MELRERNVQLLLFEKLEQIVESFSLYNLICEQGETNSMETEQKVSQKPFISRFRIAESWTLQSNMPTERMVYYMAVPYSQTPFTGWAWWSLGESTLRYGPVTWWNIFSSFFINFNVKSINSKTVLFYKKTHFRVFEQLAFETDIFIRVVALHTPSALISNSIA